MRIVNKKKIGSYCKYSIKNNLIKNKKKKIIKKLFKNDEINNLATLLQQNQLIEFYITIMYIKFIKKTWCYYGVWCGMGIHSFIVNQTKKYS